MNSLSTLLVVKKMNIKAVRHSPEQLKLKNKAPLYSTKCWQGC